MSYAPITIRSPQGESRDNSEPLASLRTKPIQVQQRDVLSSRSQRILSGSKIEENICATTTTTTTTNPLFSYTDLEEGPNHLKLRSLEFSTRAGEARTKINQALKSSIMSAEKAPNPKEKLEAQIKSADMTEDMQQEAVDVAQEAMSKFSIEKDIAQYIKKAFDERKGPTWHCIVGRNFGSFVTHETKHFIYFYLGHCAILLFKTQ